MFEEYLIKDGEHPVSIEVREAMEKAKSMGEKLNGSLLGLGSVQKVYKFPNGYGASVVKGSFTFGLWELVMIKFDGEGNFHLIGDITRRNDYEDINKLLLLIFNGVYPENAL
jgi:hypothetical protein